MSENRGASRSSLYRDQFRWAEDAVGASSTIAAAWLQKPTDDDPDAIVLGVFYFKTPGAGRHKAQVHRVHRKGTQIAATFLGSAPGHKEAHTTFYQPVLKDVRQRQRDAKAATLRDQKLKVRRVTNMAARMAVGASRKSDRRDFDRAVATV